MRRPGRRHAAHLRAVSWSYGIRTTVRTRGDASARDAPPQVGGPYARRMPWSVRSLTGEDAADVAAVFAASRRAAMPWLPVLHTPDEDVAFFASEVGSSIGWGAFDGRSARRLRARAGRLAQPPVRRARSAGQGRGLRPPARVLTRSAGPVDLWVFARNEPALTFYARHGFEVVERTDGSANEEQRAGRPAARVPPVSVRLADRVGRGGARRGCTCAAGRSAYAGLVDDVHLARLDAADRADRWRERLTDAAPGARPYVATSRGGARGIRRAPARARDDDLARQQERWVRGVRPLRRPGSLAQAVSGRRCGGPVERDWGPEIAAVALWVLRDNARARDFYAARGLAPDGAERSILIGERELAEVRMVRWR